MTCDDMQSPYNFIFSRNSIILRAVKYHLAVLT
jgi:hypothetical protein